MRERIPSIILRRFKEKPRSVSQISNDDDAFVTDKFQKRTCSTLPKSLSTKDMFAYKNASDRQTTTHSRSYILLPEKSVSVSTIDDMVRTRDRRGSLKKICWVSVDDQMQEQYQFKPGEVVQMARMSAAYKRQSVCPSPALPITISTPELPAQKLAEQRQRPWPLRKKALRKSFTVDLPQLPLEVSITYTRQP